MRVPRPGLSLAIVILRAALRGPKDPNNACSARGFARCVAAVSRECDSSHNPPKPAANLVNRQKLHDRP